MIPSVGSEGRIWFWNQAGTMWGSKDTKISLCAPFLVCRKQASFSLNELRAGSVTKCCDISQARILKWVAISSSKGSSLPRDQTLVSYIVGTFFTSWATREAQNTGVGSLSLLQGIFLTQESNWGLLHCRWILYQLSYQGSSTVIRKA